MIEPQPNLNVAPTPRWEVNWVHLTMWAVLIILMMVFLRAVQPILMPFVLGMAVAYMFDPISDRFVRAGMTRPFAAAIITFGLFALLSALAIWLGPLLYHQVVELFAKVPSLMKQLEAALQHHAAPFLQTLSTLSGSDVSGETIPSSISDIVQNSMSSFTGVLTNVLASAATMVNVMALLLITPIVCFYLIRDWPGVLKRSNELLPLVYAPTIREQLGLINKTLSAYLRGQLTVVAILIVYYCIAFVILGVNYSLLLGMVAGLLVIIPYIGPLIAIAFGLVIAYAQFGMDSNWWAMAIIYLVGHVTESNILTPKIIGDRVGLHPLWMLFGMLSGAVLFGFVGVLLAVPFTAAISVLVKFAVRRYLESSLYTEA